MNPLTQLASFVCGVALLVWGGMTNEMSMGLCGVGLMGMPMFIPESRSMGYVSRPAEVRRCLVLPPEFYDDFFDDKEFWLGWFRWQAELCGVDLAPPGVARIDAKTGMYVWHRPPPPPPGPSGISPAPPNPGLAVRH